MYLLTKLNKGAENMRVVIINNKQMIFSDVACLRIKDISYSVETMLNISLIILTYIKHDLLKCSCLESLNLFCFKDNH